MNDRQMNNEQFYQTQYFDNLSARLDTMQAKIDSIYSKVNYMYAFAAGIGFVFSLVWNYLSSHIWH